MRSPQTAAGLGADGPSPSDPAEVAALLRAYAARHDAERRANQRTIRLLMARSMRLAAIVGRLRRDAQRYEADADLWHRQRRLASLTRKEAA